MKDYKDKKVAFIRAMMNISQRRLALLLNCAESTIKSWEGNGRKIQGISLTAVRMAHFIVERGLYADFVAHQKYYEKKLSDGVTPEELLLLQQLAKVEVLRGQSSFINAD